MFPYLDNIVPTRVFAGEYSYEAQIGEEKTFSVTFFVEGDEYLLRFPDGRNEQSSTDAIMINRIRYNKIEPGLTQWLYMCLSESMRLYTIEKFKPVVKNINVDGLIYRVEFYQHKGDVKIIMPGRAFLCSRMIMSEAQPEVHFMENGKVFEKIVDLLYAAGVDEVLQEPKLINGYNFVFNNTVPVEIGRRTYIIEFDQDNDMFYLAHSGRVVMSHLDYYEKDVPELAYLHDGSVLKEIQEFLSVETKKKLN